MIQVWVVRILMFHLEVEFGFLLEPLSQLLWLWLLLLPMHRDTVLLMMQQ